MAGLVLILQNLSGMMKPYPYFWTIEFYARHGELVTLTFANVGMLFKDYCSHLSLAKPRFTENQWQPLIQGLHTIGRIARNFSMSIVYHYHAGTGVYSLDEIDFLMRHTSPELVSLLLDTAMQPLLILTLYNYRKLWFSDKICTLKDIRLSVFNEVVTKQLSFMDSVRAGVFTVPGDGDIDFSPLLVALKKIDYQGWMIVEAEQDPAKANPLK